MGRGGSSKKGAFDISLGFIIIVVFAIVLLTLGITWLRGIMGGVTGLTDDLTQQASSKLQDTFQQTTQNFGIYPSRWEMAPGRTLKMSAGIKNNVADGNIHPFVINVVPSAASSGVYSSLCPGASSLSACPNVQSSGLTLYDYMKSWVTVSIPDTFSVEPTKSVFNYITVSLPTTVPLGTYMFNVISCRTDGLNPVSTSAACTAVTTNYGSGVQPLEIIVKS